MDTKNIGDRVRILRKNNKLTQEKFSNLTGITRSYLAAVEKNRKVPSYNFVMSIANTINVDMNWLLKGEIVKAKALNSNSPKWLTDWWENADEDHKRWLKIQLQNTQ